MSGHPEGDPPIYYLTTRSGERLSLPLRLLDAMTVRRAYGLTHLEVRDEADTIMAIDAWAPDCAYRARVAAKHNRSLVDPVQRFRQAAARHYRTLEARRRPVKEPWKRIPR